MGTGKLSIFRFIDFSTNLNIDSSPVGEKKVITRSRVVITGDKLQMRIHMCVYMHYIINISVIGVSWFR